MIIYITGVLAGFLTMFINYCIGKPGSKEFSPYEIFSIYTFWLSKNRLKKMRLWKTYYDQYNQSIIRIDSLNERVDFKKDFKKAIYEAAEPYFTWERAVGMCSVCNGFWISLAVGLLYTTDLLNLFTIIVISHITIRLLNKII